MSVKEDALRLIQSLPDSIDSNELINALVIRSKIEDAETSLAKGNGVEHEEAKRRLSKWLVD